MEKVQLSRAGHKIQLLIIDEHLMVSGLTTVCQKVKNNKNENSLRCGHDLSITNDRIIGFTQYTQLIPYIIRKLMDFSKLTKHTCFERTAITTTIRIQFADVVAIHMSACAGE